MVNETIGDPIDRLAKVSSPDDTPVRTLFPVLSRVLILMKLSQNAFDYDSEVAQLSRSEWSVAVLSNGRAWYWQTCTEFGYYQSTDTGTTIFGPTIPSRQAVPCGVS